VEEKGALPSFHPYSVEVCVCVCGVCVRVSMQPGGGRGTHTHGSGEGGSIFFLQDKNHPSLEERASACGIFFFRCLSVCMCVCACVKRIRSVI
jgi:hypothetical protein